MPTRSEFVAAIKKQYPEYASAPDDKLFAAMITKYPEYKEQISIDGEGATPEPAVQASPAATPQAPQESSFMSYLRNSTPFGLLMDQKGSDKARAENDLKLQERKAEATGAVQGGKFTLPLMAAAATGGASLPIQAAAQGTLGAGLSAAEDMSQGQDPNAGKALKAGAWGAGSTLAAAAVGKALQKLAPVLYGAGVKTPPTDTLVQRTVDSGLQPGEIDVEPLTRRLVASEGALNPEGIATRAPIRETSMRDNALKYAAKAKDTHILPFLRTVQDKWRDFGLSSEEADLVKSSLQKFEELDNSKLLKPGVFEDALKPLYGIKSVPIKENVIDPALRMQTLQAYLRPPDPGALSLESLLLRGLGTAGGFFSTVAGGGIPGGVVGALATSPTALRAYGVGSNALGNLLLKYPQLVGAASNMLPTSETSH